MAIFVTICFCNHFIQLLIGHFLSKSEHNVSKFFDRNKAIVILVENSKEKENLLWNLPLLKVPVHLTISDNFFSLVYARKFILGDKFFFSEVKKTFLVIRNEFSEVNKTKKKYRRWLDVQAINVRKFFNSAPSSKRCAKSLNFSFKSFMLAIIPNMAVFMIPLFNKKKWGHR